jgi:beta-glucosidase
VREPTLLQTILRGRWGFDGYVIADYGAAHNTIASLNGGLDFEPWPPAAYQPLEINAALLSGQV